MQKYLRDYRDFSAVDLSELGGNRWEIFFNKIESHDVLPICMPFYPQPPRLQKEFDRQIQECLKMILLGSQIVNTIPAAVVKKLENIDSV